MHAYIDKESSEKRDNSNIGGGIALGLGATGAIDGTIDVLKARRRKVRLSGGSKLGIAASALSLAAGAHSIYKNRKTADKKPV